MWGAEHGLNAGGDLADACASSAQGHWRACIIRAAATARRGGGPNPTHQHQHQRGRIHQGLCVASVATPCNSSLLHRQTHTQRPSPHPPHHQPAPVPPTHAPPRTGRTVVCLSCASGVSLAPNPATFVSLLIPAPLNPQPATASVRLAGSRESSGRRMRANCTAPCSTSSQQRLARSGLPACARRHCRAFSSRQAAVLSTRNGASNAPALPVLDGGDATPLRSFGGTTGMQRGQRGRGNPELPFPPLTPAVYPSSAGEHKR